MNIILACSHPLLVMQDYKNDMDAVDPKPKKNQDADDDEADDLTDMFGQLGVTRKCQMCTIEYVVFPNGSWNSCD